MAIHVITFEFERYCAIIHRGEVCIMGILRVINKFDIKLNDQSIMINLASVSSSEDCKV